MDIATNQLKAQAIKAKKRTAHFTTKIANALKAAADAGYPIKIELGTPPDASPTIPSFEKWKRNRAD